MEQKIVLFLVILAFFIAETILIIKTNPSLRKKTIILFLAVASLAILISLIQGVLNNFFNSIFKSEKVILFVKAFFISSLLEEFIKLFSIALILKGISPRPKLKELLQLGISSAIGFSIVENILYSFSCSPNIILYRMIISVPLHISAILFSLSILNHLNEKEEQKNKKNWIIALFSGWILHGTYNFILLISDRINNKIVEDFLVSFAVVVILAVAFWVFINYHQKKQKQ